jgi:hypothetical protein
MRTMVLATPPRAALAAPRPIKTRAHPKRSRRPKRPGQSPTGPQACASHPPFLNEAGRNVTHFLSCSYSLGYIITLLGP